MKKNTLLPNWFTEPMQVWYCREDKISVRFMDFGDYKFYKYHFQDFDTFNKKILKDFKNKRRAMWFISHKKYGVFVGFVITKNELQYCGDTFQGLSYPLWNYFCFSEEKYRI